MNLIFHQAMTDLRAQRWLVAAWAAMLAAACAIEALKVEASLVYPLLALSLGRAVLGWVLAIRIVHADPLDGTSAFWLTRPLSRRMLLGAKGGLIGVLLLAVPAIAALVVFIMNGFAAAALPVILAQWLLIEALPLLPIVLVAALTRDVARQVLTLLAGLGAWWALQLSCWTLSSFPGDLGAASAWQANIVQAWLVVGMGVVVLCAVLTARHYLTRRTVAVAFAALVGADGIVAVAALWPIQLMVKYRPAWDESGLTPTSPEWRGAGGVSVSVQQESLRLFRLGGLDRLVGDLGIDGLDDDVIVRTAGGRGTVRFLVGGQVAEQRRTWAFGFGVGLASLEDAASRRHFERMLGARLVDPFSVSQYGLRLVEAKPGVFAGHEGGRAAYDANLVFDAYRVAAAAVTPLKVGAVTQVGDVSTTVLGVRWRARPARWVIDVRRAVPRILSAGDRFGVVPFLRNRERGEAMVLSGDSAGTELAALSATAVAARQLTYVPNYGIAPRDFAIDAEWLRDADVVFVTFERLGSFAKHVELPNFVLPAVRSPEP
jgi:hypothetical protein